MARKARQKISYVLPLANSAQGHRLGVNGLAIDSTNSVLYSGGRDGIIYAWNTCPTLARSPTSSPSLSRSRANSQTQRPSSPSTVWRSVQAHTHWINDIVLAQNKHALVSASSDITVKLWRPTAHDSQSPNTIGLHSDYVKVLAVPHPSSDWVASGGLDKRVCLWDLSGAGAISELTVDSDQDRPGTAKEKGSIYALASTPTILAAGGPEGILRVWDPRTAKPLTKFIGHTDNIRDVLISQDGSTVMSASSDQTVRVWDVTARRCLHTLTMHDASVWSLHSDDPRLQTFYSADKSGLVAKTDLRNVDDCSHGLSVALCHEHLGVSKLAYANNHLWTATSRHTINRWQDVDLNNAEAELPADIYRSQKLGSVPSRTRMTSFSQPRTPPQYSRRQIPIKHIMQLYPSAPSFSALSSAEPFRSTTSLNRRSSTSQQLDMLRHTVEPLRSQPDLSIPGQNGLIRYVLLNDRRRVLTLDTAGQVLMWDLIQCKAVRSFGKRQLEEVQTEINVEESVANWCSVDTRTGALTVTLEDHTCFDAEAYHDELPDIDPTIPVKKDQRINLGKWVLRYLFAGIVDQELQHDRFHRHRLMESHMSRNIERNNVPSAIKIPADWPICSTNPQSPITPGTAAMRYPSTPGLGINLATPLLPLMPEIPAVVDGPTDDRFSSEAQHASGTSQVKMQSSTKDYFSSPRASSVGATSPRPETGTPATKLASSFTDELKSPLSDEKNTPSKFGVKKFRNMSFNMKKLGRGINADKDKSEPEVGTSAPTEDDKIDGDDDDTESSNTNDSRTTEDNFLGAIQQIRLDYSDYIQQQLRQQSTLDATGGAQGRSRQIMVRSLLTPPMPPQTPQLHLPPETTILIQEDRPEADGVADMFKGFVGELANRTDEVEKAAPRWLGEVLLRDQIPYKETVKISFVLEPWNSTLPAISAEGQNRLNANRMLRARKILAYIAERIDSRPVVSDGVNDEELAQDGFGIGTAVSSARLEELKPAEDQLELLCNDNAVPPKMTLATIRTSFWKGGGDVLMYYRKRHAANDESQVLRVD